MRLVDAIFDRLKKETSCVYLVPGGGAMFLVDALGKSGIKYVSAIHEQGAGAMALGHAMASGGLGVCLVTSGPGSTNAITPCLAAWMDSIPVLFISGQARSDTLVGETGLRTRGVQEVNIMAMVNPIVKLSCELKQGSGSLNILDQMIFTCLTGRRGPCWLSIPLDVQRIEL
jgi:acetolactate synthase-1/2/3 large subunit